MDVRVDDIYRLGERMKELYAQKYLNKYVFEQGVIGAAMYEKVNAEIVSELDVISARVDMLRPGRYTQTQVQ